jgi:hypothetical protein
VSSFNSILQDGQRARWSLDDVTQRIHEIDYQRPLLPESLVRVEPLRFLDDDQRRMVNQIRAHSYLKLFSLVERFILPFAVQNAADALHRSHEELLALMQFGEEEAKHIALFERFSEGFELGFGCYCDTIGPSENLAGAVLAEDPLAVALLVLHIEWMTQDHYLRSVKDPGQTDGGPARSKSFDPAFGYLLRCHWVEEAQHARIDALLVEKLARERDENERARALSTYLNLLDALDEALGRQVELDQEAFLRAGGQLDGAGRDAWRMQQRQAYRDAFLSAGLKHPKFLAAVDRNIGTSRARLDALAAHYALRPDDVAPFFSPRAVSPPLVLAPALPSLAPASLARAGDSWSVSFGGRNVNVRHMKGIDDLVVLFSRPEQEVHCIELVGGTSDGGEALPGLDERARGEYRARIRELQEEIDEARARNDSAPAQRAEAELDALVEQLSASFGLGGRARPRGSAVERARSTVAWRIRAALKRIGQIHPELGRHLDYAVRTGTWCAYRPETPVTWELRRS